MAPICTPLMRELIFAAAESGRRERKIAAGAPASASLVKSRRVTVDRSFWYMCRVLVLFKRPQKVAGTFPGKVPGTFLLRTSQDILTKRRQISAGNRVSGAKGG